MLFSRWTFQVNGSSQLWPLALAIGVWVLVGCGGPAFFGIANLGLAHAKVGDTLMEQYYLELERPLLKAAGAEFTKAIKAFAEARGSYANQTRYVAEGGWFESVGVNLALAYLRRGNIHDELGNFRCAALDFASAKIHADIQAPISPSLSEQALRILEEARGKEIYAEAQSTLIGEGQQDCASFSVP